MTRLCLLVFSVCLYVASFTCTVGAIACPQNGTDENSSRGEPLKGISDDILAKLNSDKDLERFFRDVIETNLFTLRIDSSQEEWAKLFNKELKPYPALLNRLKNLAKILSSDPTFVEFWAIFSRAHRSTSPPTSEPELHVILEKKLRSNPALLRKLMAIVSKAMATDPDLKKAWENAGVKGLNVNSSVEEWGKFLTDATESNQALKAKLHEFSENTLRSVQSVLMAYAAFGDAHKTNGAI